MKLGGLFSGIGGFELAWQRTGGQIAWMCENNPAARRVLQARFPDVPIYRDVAEVDPDGWTDPAGSDTARYQALGNAVTVNVPH